MKKHKGPKILIFDIETAPILGYVWGLWENNVALNQIKSDWFIMSIAAKWIGEKKVMYKDLRGRKSAIKNCEDITVLKFIHKLLVEADIILTHNGDSFDTKKLNARFILKGLKPIENKRSIDTFKLAKKKFKFTSNKLAYLTDKLCVKYKKQDHNAFSGFSMWVECLKDNPKAWKVMEKYNIYDVLSLEELYGVLAPWGDGINLSVYNEQNDHVCSCGSTETTRRGYRYTTAGKYISYKCIKCGKRFQSKKNLLSKNKQPLKQ